jgi:hypothetical protein
MSGVSPKSVQWDWTGRIAKRETHLFLDEPGIGKSTVVTNITASDTAGVPWPDGEAVRNLCDVLLLVGEDGLEDTIRPRLDRAGTDVFRVHVLVSRNIIESEGGEVIEDGIRFDRDMTEIGKIFDANPDIGTVAVDPVSECFGNIDPHKNAAVRGLLKPISGFCEQYNLAWINIDNFRKDTTGPAIYRGMGSLATTAQARIAWAFVRDFNDEDRVLFLPLKNSLHKRVPRRVKLERVLSFQEQRVVQNDWTIRWRNRWFQLTQENRKLALVKRKLTVCEQLDGTVLLLLGKRALAWEELSEHPQCAAKVKGSPKSKSGEGRKPSVSHPWRRPYKSPTASTVASVSRRTKRSKKR